MAEIEQFDHVVIGLGAVGSATLAALARLGVRAAGFDRFNPPHDRGSSHGETRITRLLVGEGDAYVPLVRRSHAIWRRLEAAQGSELFRQTGLLLIGPADGRNAMHGQSDFFGFAAGLAARHGIAVEALEAAAVAARFGQFRLADGEQALFEPTGGLVFPERCIAALLHDAAAHGARAYLNEPVLAVEPHGTGVQLRSAARIVRARSAVVASGAWVAALAPALAALVRVQRQVLHWFPTIEAQRADGPVFIWLGGPRPEDAFYGFPPLVDGGPVKIAGEQYAQSCTAESLDRVVRPEEVAAMFATHAAGRLPNLREAAVRSTVCMYSVTPDSNFIVGALAGAPQITVVSACSGHGFKHAAGLGEALAERAVHGQSTADLAAFSPARFG